MSDVPRTRPVNGTEKQELVTDALKALNQLLAEDFHTVTWEQEQAARAALCEQPSHWQLICAVRRWVTALINVWRSHSGRCAQIHEISGAEDPSLAAMITIMNALSAHLELPPSCSIFTVENWPESNRVRCFVLRVAGVHVEPIDGELITKALLPRWGSPSRFDLIPPQLLAAFGPSGARPALDADPQPQQDAELLSAHETQEHLVALEASFRNAILEDVPVPYSEAVLAVFLARQAPRAAGMIHDSPLDGLRDPEADERGVFLGAPKPELVCIAGELPLLPKVNRAGRPRKDLERAKVAALRASGKSWAYIAKYLNRATGETLTVDAYRALGRTKSRTKSISPME